MINDLKETAHLNQIMVGVCGVYKVFTVLQK